MEWVFRGEIQGYGLRGEYSDGFDVGIQVWVQVWLLGLLVEGIG